MAYVYRHIRLDKNQPFYIGIGSDAKGLYTRAYTKTKRNNIWNRIISKTKYEVEIISDDMDWDSACKKEQEFIFLYGRKNNKTGILSNLTDGGDGALGYVMSKKMKKKLAEVHGKPVVKYSMEGKYICLYASCVEAERKTGIKNTQICNCANKTKSITAGGFLWEWFNGSLHNIFFDKLNYQYLRFGQKEINAYFSDGRYIGTYENLLATSVEFKIPIKSISAVLVGKHFFTKKYHFKYLDGNCDNLDVSDMYRDRSGKNAPMYGRYGEKSGNFGNKGDKNTGSKPVNQICIKTGDIINSFVSIRSAGESLGLDTSTITKVCKGNAKQTGGFKWEYKQKKNAR